MTTEKHAMGSLILLSRLYPIGVIKTFRDRVSLFKRAMSFPGRMNIIVVSLNK